MNPSLSSRFRREFPVDEGNRAILSTLVQFLLFKVYSSICWFFDPIKMSEIKKSGHLEVIFGPMFSGKTSELIRRIRRYEMSNYKCVIVRYAGDNRYSDSEVATHDGFKLKALSARNLNDVYDNLSSFDVIGIDEGQFFIDVVEVCKDLLSMGKIIVVAGLDGTFQRSGFGNVLNLVPLSTKVDKLSAVCMGCGGKASFSKRIGSETEVEVIGGAEKYMAVCRECYKLNPIYVIEPFKSVLKSV